MRYAAPMTSPFVGRRRELETVERLAVQAVAAREPAAVLITGAPGSGKSRLLAELMARLGGGPGGSHGAVDARPASGRGALLVRLVGFEPTRSIPLATIGDLLRRLATVPVDGAILDELVFRVPARASDTPPADTLRIFEAAHRAAGRLGPLILVVDDLQWVDDASLALATYLLRSAAADRRAFVVLAAARPSTAAAELDATLRALLPEDRRRAIQLGPLSIEDGVRLAGALDQRLDPEAAAELWRRSQGSPFWLLALARRADGDEPADVLDDRIRALGHDAGALLGMLAVGGRPFTPDEAAELVGWPRVRVEQAAQELAARGVAEMTIGTVALAHDLIREFVVAALPEPARRDAHARLAAWLEAAAGDELGVLREALAHRLAAGLPTLDLAIRVVESAQRRLLAGDDLRTIAAAADQETTDDGVGAAGTARLRLDRALGALAADLGEQELAIDRWIRVSRAETDAAARQAADLEAARAAYRLGRPATAREHLGLARGRGPIAPATAIHLDALEAEVALWLEHETASGSEAAGRALAAAEALAESSGGLDRLDREGRLAFLAAAEAAADAATQQDRGTDLVALGDRILQVARELDDAAYVAALIRYAFGLRAFGFVGDGHERYREAWDLARRLVMPIATVDAGHGLARSLRDLGRLREAHDVADETARLERRIGNAPRRWGSARSIAHSIELSLGAPGPTIRALRLDAAEEPDPHYRIAIHQMIGTWQARTLGPAAADDVLVELDRARTASELARCPRCARDLEAVSTELLARVGRVEEAERGLAQAVVDPPTTSRNRKRLYRWAEAALAEARSDPDGAARILDGIAAELEPDELLEDLLWVRIDLGRVLVDRDRPRAVAELSAAAELAERMGAISQGRLIAGRLRAAGVRAWRRGPATVVDDGDEGDDGHGRSGRSTLAALSRRELEVARLVAAGASNREIAGELVVSPKTIERHVTNVLAKLGLRNRTELAALVRSSDGTGSPR